MVFEKYIKLIHFQKIVELQPETLIKMDSFIGDFSIF